MFYPHVSAPPTGILIVATGDTDVFGASDLSMEVHNVTTGESCKKTWPQKFPVDVEEASGGLLKGQRARKSNTHSKVTLAKSIFLQADRRA